MRLPRGAWLAPVVAILAALASPARAAAPLLRPSPAGHGSYGETYTFLADLEDGGYLHLSLGLTTLGPGGIKGICRALVVPPEGPLWKGSERVGRDGWRWEDGATERLAIAACSAWNGADASGVEVKVDGATIRVELSGPLGERVPPEATISIGREFYRTSILGSRLPARVSLALPGQPARTVAGSAFVDHSRSTVKPRDLAKRWIRFRALRGERGLLLLGREGHDGRFTPGWACDDPGPCRRFPSFQVTRNGEKPPSFRATLRADELPIAIDSGKLLFRDAPLDDLGVLGPLVAPFVGAPVTYVYRGQLTGNGPPLSGVFEVQLDGE